MNKHILLYISLFFSSNLFSQINFQIEKNAIMTLSKSSEEYQNIKYSPNSNLLASYATLGKTLFITNAVTKEKWYSFKVNNDDYISTVAFSNNENYLACGTEKGNIYIIDLIKNEKYAKFNNSNIQITTLGFNKDDTKLICSDGLDLSVWHLQSKNKLDYYKSITAKSINKNADKFLDFYEQKCLIYDIKDINNPKEIDIQNQIVDVSFNNTGDKFTVLSGSFEESKVLGRRAPNATDNNIEDNGKYAIKSFNSSSSELLNSFQLTTKDRLNQILEIDANTGLYILSSDNNLYIYNKEKPIKILKKNYLVETAFEQSTKKLVFVFENQLNFYEILFTNGKKENSLTNRPIIYITNPIENKVYDSKTILIDAVINSESKITASEIKINGKIISNRDFEIVENDINKTFQIKINKEILLDKESNKILLEIVASNITGETTVKRNFNIVEKDVVIKKKESPNPIPNPLPLAEKRVALIIGNSTYKVGALKNPVNDANSMEIKLKSLGFVVFKYVNCSQYQIKKAIADFGSKLDKETVSLVFYAGHGIEVNRKNYLIPIDANIAKEADVDLECISMDNLIDQMTNANSYKNILILDACRNNPFSRSWGRSSSNRGITSLNSSADVTILYATTPGSTASDGENTNGLFTECFINNLSISNLNLFDIILRTKEEVVKKSNGNQKPYLEGTPFNFIFNIK